MDRDEILKKCQEDGIYEMEDTVADKSAYVGSITISLTAAIIILLGVFTDKNVWTAMAMLFSFWSAQYAYKYAKLRVRHHLFLAILSGLVAIIELIVWLNDGH